MFLVHTKAKKLVKSCPSYGAIRTGAYSYCLWHTRVLDSLWVGHQWVAMDYRDFGIEIIKIFLIRSSDVTFLSLCDEVWYRGLFCAVFMSLHHIPYKALNIYVKPLPCYDTFLCAMDELIFLTLYRYILVYDSFSWWWT